MEVHILNEEVNHWQSHSAHRRVYLEIEIHLDENYNVRFCLWQIETDFSLQEQV